ncbi:peptide-methionine (S)-S-oxide reductase MsrA [Algoriphagus aestuariicola]|uniref:Peptide methionine sulfoxide reductase MsrA n=1 Tax=Algoriphagus aestuariicola TaxID=1852016 RepID=A0ABS3BMB6_9BACT|nr:peptide-methionine (S)-S-oxide reductase MsrA [Algoriphagus aestuariicola]MBN7800455.1 peptide-methionine (S)-S-oxide reductase MsrA [Algoriphagus aestuariicola]
MSKELNLPLTTTKVPKGLELITLGAGCFWCTEAVFQRLDGVEKVTSGYAGGIVESPTYKEICTGTTGHAEVINVLFDPAKVSLESLLEVFWATHDPTTLNRQGADIGPQYRSAIFFHTEEQREIASRLKEELNARKVFDLPIVTEITAFTNFYPAENYHQEYFNLNSMQPYCQFVVRPKVDKLKRYFGERLKING